MSLRAGNEDCLSRVTSNSNNNYNLIRLLLSASVIYYHSFGMTSNRSVPFIGGPANLNAFANIGAAAVALFFCLSGLFVSQSLFNDKSVIRFALKRFLRVWPGYFVCLAVTALIASAISHPYDFWKYLLFPDFYDYIICNAMMDIRFQIHGVFDWLPFKGGMNGSIHTIPLEVRMYAILFVFGLLMLVRSRKTITITAATTLAVLYFFPAEFQDFIGVQDSHRLPIAMFFVGMGLYGVSRILMIQKRQAYVIVPVFFLSAVYAIEVTLYISLVWAMLLFGQSRRIRRWIPLNEDISYGLYIYGWPCTQFIAAFYPDMNPYYLAVNATALTSSFAFASWRLVERPLMRLKNISLMPGRHHDPRSEQPERHFFTKPKFVGSWVAIVFAICVAMDLISPHLTIGPQIPMVTSIINYGPRSTPVGKGFNVSPSTGESGMWLALSGPAPEGAKLKVGNQLLLANVQPGVVTAGIPKSLLQRPVTLPVRLENRFYDHLEYSNSVQLVVEP